MCRPGSTSERTGLTRSICRPRRRSISSCARAYVCIGGRGRPGRIVPEGFSSPRMNHHGYRELRTTCIPAASLSAERLEEEVAVATRHRCWRRQARQSGAKRSSCHMNCGWCRQAVRTTTWALKRQTADGGRPPQPTMPRYGPPNRTFHHICAQPPSNRSVLKNEQQTSLRPSLISGANIPRCKAWYE